MADKLLELLTERGHRTALVPVARLHDLVRDMEELEAGAYHTGFIDWAAKRREKFFPRDLPFEVRSVLLVATHSPVRQVGFVHDGRAFRGALPPTYVETELLEVELPKLLDAFLTPRGFHAAPAPHLPCKLLAVRSGLGEYGRNNIFYAGDWGSHVNLMTFYTDVPCGETPWQPARRMAACENCRACVEACPTGAIDAGRSIINAERCLTAMNEREAPFPDWVEKTAHNALVGCLRCQQACPRNAATRGFVLDGPTFDDAETAAILAHPAGEEFPEDLTEKFRQNGMYWYRNELPRNLAVLLETRE